MFAFFFHNVLSAMPVNYALSFNGSGVLSLGRFKELDNIEKFTFQFWLCPSQWESGTHIIEKGNSFRFMLGAENQLCFQFNQRIINITSANLSVNNWTHLTIMNGDGQIKFLVNNNLIYNESQVESLVADDEPLYVGLNYTGRIDELRIYKNTLSGDYDNFWQNTLTDLTHQWNDLLGYYKFDQFTCENIVDYTGKNHGTMSISGVSREVVTDNADFQYLLSISYINYRRFGWANLDEKKMQLTNHLLIISGKTDANGNAWIDFRENNANFTNAEYVKDYDGRNGLVHFKGQGAQMDCGVYPIEKGTFTFGAWLYIEEWIQDSVIVKKYLSDAKGIIVKLGDSTKKSFTLHINGNNFTVKNKLQEKKWTFFAFAINSTADSMLHQVMFIVEKWSIRSSLFIINRLFRNDGCSDNHW
ncbi:hypothetical protein TVAG_219220 [Trichomonas vaginalis G3]|uniref:LamG-like jellyroll fold domain-containing protein n=1 Tax=Trichomonas vaginalis (strain ATCC PRA-98 / G3) TaxID=412133 RepID=A2FKQ4_TRIV3|nr:concanavalin A-like lectin/glucanases superfamily [Trichomonas vaginalis G3]EAX94516.1 hypothetical protein TVAG_219220 [Trichomonas vaginalis G3]KAI5501098.1 concanavalin A-like lectin/glucanases superfamily [Trichomonas vaginalis G3]|eukprot:XP_001307446.1 hypothetical protein [Trichomonas vaginalis G3]